MDQVPESSIAHRASLEMIPKFHPQRRRLAKAGRRLHAVFTMGPEDIDQYLPSGRAVHEG